MANGAIKGGSLTVGTTAVQVDGNFKAWSHIHIRNNDNTKDLLIGGDDLTAANGMTVKGLDTIDFDIPPGEAFYLLATSGTVSVSWLRIDVV